MSSSTDNQGQSVNDLISSLEFSTELVGVLNGEAIRLVGTGTIDEVNGRTEGVFDLIRLPEDVDARALGAFLFTGYPNSCRTSDVDAGNPFSGGSYSYFRQYDFNRAGRTATLKVKCDLSPNRTKLSSIFDIEGHLPVLGSVRGVSPIYELWSPTPDVVEGLFSVAWLSDSGSVIETATAASSYTAVQPELLHGMPKHRFIGLDSRMKSARSLEVVQNSNLMANSM